MNVLKNRMDEKNYLKLMKIDNPDLHQFIAKYVELCNPKSVFVNINSEEDVQYIRDATIANKEEAKLAIDGHTVHSDGYQDQARDKKNTKFLLPKGIDLGPEINAMDREEGLTEIHSILKDIMQDKELFVNFFCLGPIGSEFSILCVQLTDSSYVAHSEELLYRPGYLEFVRLGGEVRFFKFVHSQGELEEIEDWLRVSKTIEKRRIYIDLEGEIIYSTNTQYGGNTIGLKKLSLRLAMNRASEEGWLAEHMLILGIHGPNNRISYFMGAFPSMCGKTSTAMLPGEMIVGDDIAYLKKDNGEARAVNVEKGIFGIIEGINSTDDPIIWEALNREAEIIFSNVLVDEERGVYWSGKNVKCPEKGYNHSGKWFLGKKDAEGKEIPPSHKNARFTFDMKILDNLDPEVNNPKGVKISGVIYGGRDSNTWVPVEESFDWIHGIITKGSSIESETTAATLGEEGKRVFNPMANLDFLSIPIGRYIENNLNFGKDLKNPPRVFSVNYFLKGEDGKFLNNKGDKRVWLKWMELRVHNEVDAIKTPTGFIPKYQDLKSLFKSVLNKDYLEKNYIKQFSLRVPENLAKIDRLIDIYRTRVLDTSNIVFEILEKQKEDLEKIRSKFGDYIPPEKFIVD
ncbi:phosphoenolpyruvate carboxykinase (GTP) [[Eubacterium] cellulosolvens]